MDNPGFEPESGSAGKLGEPPLYEGFSNADFIDLKNSKAKSSLASSDDLNNKLKGSISQENVGDGGTVRMKRQIGLLGGTSLIVGTMIGSGIFVSPSGLLERTDSIALSLCVWAACGLLATFTAISYCELGTAVPRSGGEHAYFMATFSPMHKFFGELPAFLFAWMTVLLLKPSSLSIISLSFGQYALSPVLSMSGYCDDFKNDSDYDMAKKLLAICIACVIAGVNIFSARLATNVQVVFTGAKLTAMIVIICIGIYNFSRGEFGAIGALDGKFDEGTTDVGTIAVAFYSGLWAYDGWNNLNFVTEELENPSRNLPLSIVLAIPLVTILYLAVNISYLTVLDKNGLIDSSAVAVDVGNEHLGMMKFVMPLLVTLSTIGSGNGSMFTAGRISYVAGRDGHMVDILSYVHATRRTPTIAILLNTLLAIPMIFSSDINKLIDFFSFASWIIYGLALTCVIILRFTQPNLKRPIRVPLVVPALAVIVSIVLVLAPLISDPQLEYFYVLGFSGIGIIVYSIFVYGKRSLPFMNSLTKAIQLTALVAPSPYKED